MLQFAGSLRIIDRLLRELQVLMDWANYPWEHVGRPENCQISLDIHDCHLGTICTKTIALQHLIFGELILGAVT